MNDKKYLLAGLLPFVLAACGGGDDGEPTVQARLLDSAVQGAQYVASPSGLKGNTAADGSLNCQPGDKITFSVGGVALGTVSCQALISVSDLAGTNSLAAATLRNRLVFLQTLDEDDDPTNGIRITSAVATALAKTPLNFALAEADFDLAFKAVLPSALDAYGQPYQARALGELRRQAAVEHYESTLATLLGKPGTTISQDSAGGTVRVTKYQLYADKALYIPYEGTNAAAQADFPNGFYPAVGSGLAFKGKAADGSLEFWGITDRGPNGDSPNAPVPGSSPIVSGASKIFLAPSFTPSIGVINISAKGAVLKSMMPLKSDATQLISGRPLPFTSVGSSLETPLNDALKYDAVKGAFDAQGLDSESLVYDSKTNKFWTSDEYGPFIVRINAATGVIEKRYAPGVAADSLPAVLKHRRANRGMEGLTLDAASGKLHGFLQSPIDPLDASNKSIKAVDSLDLDGDGSKVNKVNVKDYAQFARWIEFDPVTETSKLYAYPLNYALSGDVSKPANETKWDRNRTGSAKLGDVVSLGNGKFLVIEQGADGTGAVRNFLMLVEVPTGATNIATLSYELEQNSIDGVTASATQWADVVKLKKTLLMDLNAAGWRAEKAEGLTLVDGQTVALINDSDFGLRTVLTNAVGTVIDGDPTKCTVNDQGVITDAGVSKDCPAGAVGVRVTRGNEVDRHTRIWLLKFPKAVSSYTLP